MVGRRFACFEVDDDEVWSVKVDGHPNVIKGEATVFCKLWMDVCGNDDDRWEFFKVHKWEWPSVEEAKEFDAIIIPGARHSAYDLSIPWIPKFTQILREYAENGIKLVGGCFGHQILALALGGQVGKNPSGKYVLKVETVKLLPTLLEKLQAGGIETPSSNSFESLECHGDQVLELPPGAVLLARSPTAVNEIWSHGENVLAVQSHPEVNSDNILKKLVTKVVAAGYFKEEEADGLYEGLTTPRANHIQLTAFLRNFVHSGPRRGEEKDGVEKEEEETLENIPPSRTQKVKEEFNRLYTSTVDMIDSLPLSTTGMSFSAFKKGMGFGQGGKKTGESTPVSEEEYVSPGVQQVRGALENSAKSFFGKVATLMRLELERGFIQYDRLEVANRLAGAEFQKLAEAVKEVGEGRKAVEVEHERVGNDVHQVLDELSEIVSQIETAVAKLAEDTENLEKKTTETTNST